MKKSIVIERAERLHQIPLNRPLKLSRYLKRLANKGIEPIDLTTSFISTPNNQEITDRMFSMIPSTEFSDNTTGARQDSAIQFRKVFSDWFAYRFDVEINPELNLLPFAGMTTGGNAWTTGIKAGRKALVS